MDERQGDGRDRQSDRLLGGAVDSRVRPATPASRDAQVNLRIETESVQFQTAGQVREAHLEILFGERATDGTTHLSSDTATMRITAERWATAQEEGLRYSHRWKPAPGALSLRIVVRDMISGQYGYARHTANKLVPARN
jgi:hypothetical protein